MYISQDPIKLNGGYELYSCVFDTNTWIDVFGLNRNLNNAKENYSIYKIYDKDPAIHKDAKVIKMGKEKS